MVTDLNGYWKMKSDNEIFQIEQIKKEYFKVLEPDNNKEYEFHLSLNPEMDGQISGGHITSVNQFWDRKLILFRSNDSFTLTGIFGGQHWHFERIEKFE
jgi:hypothetical protein